MTDTPHTPETPRPQGQPYWGNPPQTPLSKHAYVPAPPATPQSGQIPSEPVASTAPDSAPATSTGPIPYAAQDATHNPAPNTGYQTRVDSMPQPNPATQQQPAMPPAPPTPNAPKKKGVGLIVTIIVLVVLFVGIGGCVACSAVVTAFDDARHTSGDSYSYSYEYDSETGENANQQLRSYFALDSNSAEPLTRSELDNIAQYGISSSSTGSNQYAPGVYIVGENLPEGSYWFDGYEDSLSYFFVLDAKTSNGQTTYTTNFINNYYGHNLLTLKAGQVLILDNKKGMVPLDKMTQKFSSPYGNGVYRVGTDIPAGTYKATVGSASDYSAYYVMKDLNYTEDSYLDQDIFFSDARSVEVTLTEGTYVELYNMSLRSTVA